MDLGQARWYLCPALPVRRDTTCGSVFTVNSNTNGYERGLDASMDAQGNFVIVWAGDYPETDGLDILSRRFASDGTPIGSQVLVNSYTNGTQTAPSVAMAPDGRYVVAWHGFNHPGGDEYDIYFQRFDALGKPVGSDARALTPTLLVVRHTPPLRCSMTATSSSPGNPRRKTAMAMGSTVSLTVKVVMLMDSGFHQHDDAGQPERSGCRR